MRGSAAAMGGTRRGCGAQRPDERTLGLNRFGSGHILPFALFFSSRKLSPVMTEALRNSSRQGADHAPRPRPSPSSLPVPRLVWVLTPAFSRLGTWPVCPLFLPTPLRLLDHQPRRTYRPLSSPTLFVTWSHCDFLQELPTLECLCGNKNEPCFPKTFSNFIIYVGGLDRAGWKSDLGQIIRLPPGVGLQIEGRERAGLCSPDEK